MEKNMSSNEGLKAYRSKDFEKAFDIWSKEAEDNSDQAMTNLGLMYLKGDGVKKDLTLAKEWFEKALKYDNDSAAYNLALMYQAKIGVEEDIDKAIEYFRRAVAKNHQGANFRLGLLMLQDRTNLERVKEGFNCMLNAAKSGHPMAKAQMGGVENSITRDDKTNEEFRKKDRSEQIAILEDAVNRYIRPILIKDGGDITLIEYLNDSKIEIRLAYMGACAGCSLGATSTYGLIFDTLSSVIDKQIEVYVI
jgi:TPR repeat protein